MSAPAPGVPRAGLPLFWRVCLTNGLVFVIGTAVLAASPATVSSPVVVTETVVLAVGLGVILATNALLLRSTLAPARPLMRLMARVDLLRPGQRLPETGNGASAQLVVEFNAMLSRLESERSQSSARALAAQEAERQRIAQELHDEVGQSLTVVVLGLTGPPRARRPSCARTCCQRGRRPGRVWTRYAEWRVAYDPASSTTSGCSARCRRWRRTSVRPRVCTRRVPSTRPSHRSTPTSSWSSSGSRRKV